MIAGSRQVSQVLIGDVIRRLKTLLIQGPIRFTSGITYADLLQQ